MTPPDMPSSLPVELFELIAENVRSGSREELTSLRRSGSRSAAKVMRLYKECRFAEITVRLSDLHSISNATAIVDDRTIGPAIRTLVLEDDSINDPTYDSDGASPWDTDSYSPTDSSIDSEDDSENDDSEDVSEDEPPSEDDSASTSSDSVSDKQVQKYAPDPFIEAQTRMRRSGEDRRMLIKLFGKFGSNRKRSTKVGVLFRSHRGESECDSVRDDHCLAVVMLAIASTSPNVDVFSMDVGCDQGIPVVQYGQQYQKGIVCKAALSHFRSVDLVLHIGDNDDDDYIENPYNTRSFLEMIAALKIRSLEVKPLFENEEWPVVSTLLELKFPEMEKLEFGQVEVPWKALVSFLKRQKSLRELKLDEEEALVSGHRTSRYHLGSSKGRDKLSRLTKKPSLIVNGMTATPSPEQVTPQ